MFLFLLLLSVAIPANSTKWYYLDYNAKDIASINVSGLGQGDIDCYLVDRQHHKFLAKDESMKDSCHIMVEVPETKAYLLVIDNHGDKPTLFSLGANSR